jgi:hypothetical protein
MAQQRGRYVGSYRLAGVPVDVVHRILAIPLRVLEAARRAFGRSVLVTGTSLTGNALTDADLILPVLAARIRSPNEPRSFGDLAGGMFAARAADIYAGFVHALEGPSKAAPTILIRPLVELAIQTHWIAMEPDRNFRAWRAHSEEQDAKALREIAKHLPRPVGDLYTPEKLAASAEAKEADVAARRAELGRATGPLRPGLTEIIEALAKRDQGAALALWQAYDDAYRATSPTTHSEATSFKQSLEERPDGTVDYVEAPPVPTEVLRHAAAGCLAFTLEAAAAMTGQPDIAIRALELRLRLAVVPNGSAGRTE